MKVLYRAPSDVMERVDAAAKQKNLSRNNTITQLLTFALDAHEKEQAERKEQRQQEQGIFRGPGAAAKPPDVHGPGAAARRGRK